jgi:hypothetical protein
MATSSKQLSVIEPVYLYSIPQDVLSTLQPRASTLTPYSVAAEQPLSDTLEQPALESKGIACNLCLGASFTDVHEQRAHFRSDWHRYNVKMRLNDAASQPVTEPEFNNLIEGM